MRRGLVYFAWTAAAQLADDRFTPASAALLVLAILVLSEVTLAILGEVMDREEKGRRAQP